MRARAPCRNAAVTPRRYCLAHGGPLRRLPRGSGLGRDGRPGDRAARRLPARARRARPALGGRAARPDRLARELVPRAGRDVRLRRRGAALPARRRAPRASSATSGRTSSPGSRSACARSRRSSTTSTAASTASRDGVAPGGAHRLVAALPPAGAPASTPPTACASRSSGIDLIRDEHGEMRVLEDNVRVPSGVSYVHLEPPRHGADAPRAVRARCACGPVGDYPQQAARRPCARRPRPASTTRTSSC